MPNTIIFSNTRASDEVRFIIANPKDIDIDPDDAFGVFLLNKEMASYAAHSPESDGCAEEGLLTTFFFRHGSIYVHDVYETSLRKALNNSDKSTAIPIVKESYVIDEFMIFDSELDDARIKSVKIVPETIVVTRKTRVMSEEWESRCCSVRVHHVFHNNKVTKLLEYRFDDSAKEYLAHTQVILRKYPNIDARTVVGTLRDVLSEYNLI